jgi:hypothetical protein
MRETWERLGELPVASIRRMLAAELAGVSDQLHNANLPSDRSEAGLAVYLALEQLQRQLRRYQIAAVYPALAEHVPPRVNTEEGLLRLAHRAFQDGESLPVWNDLQDGSEVLVDTNADPALGKVLSSTAPFVVNPNGRLVNDVSNVLSGSIAEADLKVLRERAEEVIRNLPNPKGKPEAVVGLMLGLIQAGKTAGMIMTTAMAADNGYPLTIVLTSDNLWLHEQTIKRFKKTLVMDVTYADMNDWATKKAQIQSSLGHSAVVLVTTKNHKHLESLLTLLHGMNTQNVPVVIFDDEADQASLSTTEYKPNEAPAKVNKCISDIRDYFTGPKAFIQVTATPQALLLQKPGSAYRPRFVTLLTPGKGYVGGDVFLEDDSPYLEYVAKTEIDDIITGRAKVIPKGLRQAIATFLIATAMKLEVDGYRHYSCLCHISLSQNDHETLRDLVSGYVQKVTAVLKSASTSDTAEVEGDLQSAYDSLVKTANGAPAFDVVKSKLRDTIASLDYQVLNSSNPEKQAKYDSLYNVLIGGTKLGRGVTIENLLVTYYGRDSKVSQMDTVQQHARMYGYRQKELEVSRIFLPEGLAQYFRDIRDSDALLRDWLAENPNMDFVPIEIPNTKKKMRPTRKQVLNPDNVGAYMSGRTYTARLAHYEENDTSSARAVLDTFLEYPACGKERTGDVPIDMLVQVLEKTAAPNGGPGRFSRERILLALRALKHRGHGTGRLVVFTDRNIGQTAKTNVMDSGDELLADETRPTLFMYRQNGGAWSHGPFWLPVFRFPNGKKEIFYSCDAEGNG